MTGEAENPYRLAVVVINYRTPATTIDCLQTLLPQLSRISSCVQVIDNDSRDDSLERLEAWIDAHRGRTEIELVANASNCGFAAGNNLGQSRCAADYYLFLNSDTKIRAGAIDTLLGTAAEYTAAGLVSPRLEFENGRPQASCFSFHSPLSEFCRAAQTGMLDRLFARFQVTLPVQNQVTTPAWTSFACVLVKQEVFAAVGLMDEDFFMYFEDCEFCLRAGRAGWQIVHNPAARVIHLRGGSSNLKQNIATKKRLPRYYYESRARYFYRLSGWLGLTAANLGWSLGRLISKIRQLAGRPDKAAIDAEWRDIWINWLSPAAQYTHPESPER